MNIEQADDLCRDLERLAPRDWAFRVDGPNQGRFRILASLPAASHSKNVVDMRTHDDARVFLRAVYR